MAKRSTKKDTRISMAEVVGKVEPAQCTELSMGDGFPVIQVKNRLTMQEAMEFVSYVCSLVTNEETGEYTPEVEDFANRLYTIVCWGGVKEPKTADEAWNLVYSTNLYDRVLDCIDHDQYDILVWAIDRKIQFFKGRMEAACASEVRALMTKMDEVMESGARMLSELDNRETLNAISDMAKLSEANEHPKKADNLIPFGK